MELTYNILWNPIVVFYKKMYNNDSLYTQDKGG